MKRILLILLSLLLVSAPLLQAQFTYTTNNAVITLTRYTGSSGMVTVSNFVTIIGDGAFQYTIVSNVVIPNSVTSIGSNAFQYCDSLSGITIPNSITNIGPYAFNYCGSLTNVAIPSGVTSISDYMFEQCGSLTNVTIPYGVTSIGDGAFENSGLMSVTMPASVTSIGAGAFAEDPIGGPWSLTSVTIPGSVTNIGEEAFSTCINLTNVTIDDGVAAIGNFAFYACQSLTNVIIPASVTNIGAAPFYWCSSLPAISVAAGNPAYVSVAGALFNHNQTLLVEYPEAETATNYSVPGTVTSIGQSAFYDCANLAGVTLPTGVTNIGADAFDFCTYLSSINIPYGVTSIGDSTFYACESLYSIALPGSVTSIGAGAFDSCALSELVIPDSVTSIGENAFTRCGLGDVRIPSSVTNMAYAFEGSYLTNVTFADGSTSIGTYAFEYSDLTNVKIPGSVTNIAEGAFYDCSHLASAVIPSGVASIGNYAFYDCTSLASVTIPASVANVGILAFSGCSNLSSIWALGNEIYIDYYGFGAGNVVYYLPGTTGWSNLYPALIDDPFVWVTNGGGITITGFSGSDVDLPIPGTISGLPVTGIGAGAFANSQLTTVMIPASVTNIGAAPFQGCINLTGISVDPANPALVSLGGVLFNRAQTALVEFPAGLPATSYAIPENVTNVADQAFYGCASLTNITISSTVVEIGNEVFFGCTDLAAISVAAGNPAYFSVEGILFNHSQTALIAWPPANPAASYVIPNGVTTIEDGAFAECTNLISVTIPTSVTSIGASTFEDDYNLISLYFEGNAPGIGTGAFFGDFDACAYYPPGASGWTTFPTIPATPASGSLQVIISPSAAINAGAQWQVDNGPWQNVETVMTNLATGAHTVTFNTFDGWSPTTPLSQSVSISPNSFTTITANFVPTNFDYSISQGTVTINAYLGTNAVVSIPGVLSDLPVTGIAAFAFPFAEGSLTSVTIPASVTNIDGDTFYDCTNLSEINADPQNPAYTSVNGVLFNKSETTLVQYPAGLVGSYVVPTDVTNIEDAFAGCLLTNVTLSASVANIDPNAFLGCSGLAAINVASANPAYGSLGGVLFNKMQTIIVQFPPGLTGSYVIPGTVTNIGSSFDGCSLSHLAIPGSVTSIEDLSGCHALAGVSLSNGVASIGAFAFNGDAALASVVIPASVTYIGQPAFYQCYGLTNITVAAGNPNYSSAYGVLYDKGQQTLLEFPGGVGGGFAIPPGVTSVGQYAFSGTSASSVTMPGSVSNISAEAFSFDNSLTNVTIGDGVVSIGAGAFAYCDFLTYITIPNSVASLGADAFWQCGKLAAVTVGSGVASIGADAFENCANLEGVYFLGNAPTAVSDVFDDDNNLSGIYYNPGTTGWGTFLGGGLSVDVFGYTADGSGVEITNYAGPAATVTIPASIGGQPVIGIGAWAFANTGVLGVTIPDTVTSIGESAFAGCANLAFVTLANTVTNIGDGAFYASGLTNFVIPEGVTAVGATNFYDCEYLASVTIPNSVTSIGTAAFQYCGLSSITIPDSVTNLGLYAFSGSGLATVTIPNGITSIPGDAFFDCEQLASVTFSDNLGDIGTNAFDYCLSLESLVIPAGLTNMGEAAFANCDHLASVYFEGNAPNADSTVFIGDPVVAYYLPGTAGWSAQFAGVHASARVPITFSASPSAGAAPLTVRFTTASSDNEGKTLTAWKWNFGDGSTSTAQNPSHTYTNAGTFVPALIATNSVGDTDLGVGTSLITATNPMVSFSANPLAGSAPLIVAFSAAAVDSTGNAINQWHWDFGDGTTGAGTNPSHTYADAGYFSPVLTATNSMGGTVNGFGPSSISVSNTTVAFTVSQEVGPVPLMVTFSSATMDSADNAITQWNWNFGDGTAGTGASPSHTYTTAGIYYPVLTATNSLGGEVLGLGPTSIFVKSGLVLNGGFETGDFTGWTLSGGDPADTFVDNGTDSGIAPHSGEYSGALGSQACLSYLSQTLSTTPGTTYLLSLWLNSPDGQMPNEFLVSWNGSVIFDRQNIPTLGWTNLQFSVSAASAATMLEFGFRDDPSFLGLDDVSVAAPQPLSIATLVSSSTNLVFNGINGLSNQTYYVLTASNLALPLSQWTRVATNVLTANGNFTITVTNTVSRFVPQRFYILQSP